MIWQRLEIIDDSLFKSEVESEFIQEDWDKIGGFEVQCKKREIKGETKDFKEKEKEKLRLDV